MKVLTTAEVAEWFLQSKDWNDDYARYDDEGLFYSHPEASCIDLEYPPKLEQLAFFAHLISTIGYEDGYFNGALMWISLSGVWNLYDEGVGYRMIERINAAAGQPKSFEVGRAHQFRADELPDAIGMLLQPMIFGWDAYYLPAWAYGTGEFFLHISHDSYVTIVTKTKSFHEKTFQELEKLNLSPKRGPDKRLSRFCRRPW